MKLKIIVAVSGLVLLVVAVVGAVQIQKILQYEQRGLQTRSVCMSLIEFVETQKRWPASWDELSLPVEKIDSYKESVDVRFGLSLPEVSDLLSSGEPVVKPKLRSLQSFESALRELGRVVYEAVEEGINDPKENAAG